MRVVSEERITVGTDCTIELAQADQWPWSPGTSGTNSEIALLLDEFGDSNPPSCLTHPAIGEGEAVRLAFEGPCT